MVLSPNSEFFRYFGDQKPAGASRPPRRRPAGAVMLAIRTDGPRSRSGDRGSALCLGSGTAEGHDGVGAETFGRPVAYWGRCRHGHGRGGGVAGPRGLFLRRISRRVRMSGKIGTVRSLALAAGFSMLAAAAVRRPPRRAPSTRPAPSRRSPPPSRSCRNCPRSPTSPTGCCRRWSRSPSSRAAAAPPMPRPTAQQDTPDTGPAAERQPG